MTTKNKEYSISDDLKTYITDEVNAVGIDSEQDIIISIIDHIHTNNGEIILNDLREELYNIVTESCDFAYYSQAIKYMNEHDASLESTIDSYASEFGAIESGQGVTICTLANHLAEKNELELFHKIDFDDIVNELELDHDEWLDDNEDDDEDE